MVTFSALKLSDDAEGRTDAGRRQGAGIAVREQGQGGPPCRHRHRSAAGHGRVDGHVVGMDGFGLSSKASTMADGLSLPYSLAQSIICSKAQWRLTAVGRRRQDSCRSPARPSKAYHGPVKDGAGA